MRTLINWLGKAMVSIVFSLVVLNTCADGIIPIAGDNYGATLDFNEGNNTQHFFFFGGTYTMSTELRDKITFDLTSLPNWVTVYAGSWNQVVNGLLATDSSTILVSGQANNIYGRYGYGFDFVYAVKCAANYGSARSCSFSFTRKIVKGSADWSASRWSGVVTIRQEASSSVTYTITYKPGSYSSGNSVSDTKQSGVPLTLRDALFTRTGYTQEGWSKNASGSTRDYLLNASYTTDAAVTLYPYWTANTYSITYALNGGTHGTTHPTGGTYDTAFYVSAPTRSGYTFAGWTVTSGLNTSTAKWGTSSKPTTSISSTSTKCVNGMSGDVYFKNLTAVAKGNVTLAASWTANAGPSNDSFTNAEVFTGRSGRLTGSNDGATSQSGEPLLKEYSSATTTVWWKWTAPSSGSVTIDTVGSSFDTQMGIYTGSSLTSLSLVKKDDDSGENMTSVCTFDCTGGTTYYICVGGYKGRTGTVKLQWNLAGADGYNITYDLGGGWGSVIPSSAGDGESFFVWAPANVADRTFIGWKVEGNLGAWPWYFDANGNGQVVSNGSTFYGAGSKWCTFMNLGVAGGTVKLTAMWRRADGYSITYDLGGGWGSAIPSSAGNGESFFVWAPANVAGYKFIGWRVDGDLGAWPWYFDANGNGQVVSGGFVSYGADSTWCTFLNLGVAGGTVRLTAMWTRTHYAVGSPVRTAKVSAQRAAEPVADVVYSGTFDDGAGRYMLMLGCLREDGCRDGFVYMTFADGTTEAAECDVVAYEHAFVVLTGEECVYSLDR